MLGVVKHTETNQVAHKSVGDDVRACRVTRNGQVAWTEVSEASKGWRNEQMSHEGDWGALTQWKTYEGFQMWVQPIKAT